MAKPRRSPVLSPPAVTTERAARLCRLLRLLAPRGQTRASLLKRLRIDIRGFYRDLQLLREVGIIVELEERKYTLKGEAEEMILHLPFPDPHFTLGEAAQLAKGRTVLHRKLRTLLNEILES